MWCTLLVVVTLQQLPWSFISSCAAQSSIMSIGWFYSTNNWDLEPYKFAAAFWPFNDLGVSQVLFSNKVTTEATLIIFNLCLWNDGTVRSIHTYNGYSMQNMEGCLPHEQSYCSVVWLVLWTLRMTKIVLSTYKYAVYLKPTGCVKN